MAKILPHRETTPNVMISVIIISFNTCEMTLNCLRSVYDSLQGRAAEIFVIDNASTDGTVDAINEAYPQVNLIKNVHNQGFGAANNQGMQQAQGSFFLLLNSDAFPMPDAISHLAEYLAAHKEVAVVGPRLINQDGSHQMSWHSFPSPMSEWKNRLWLSALQARFSTSHRDKEQDVRREEESRIYETDYVNGACMLVRQEAYQQVGGFDERFFMYYEEADWQRRFVDHGWKLAYEPAAEVTHLHGASSRRNKMWIYRHLYDALDYYIWKHYKLLGLVSLRIGVSIGALLNLFRYLPLKILRSKDPSLSLNLQMYSWLLARQLTKLNLSPEKRGGK